MTPFLLAAWSLAALVAVVCLLGAVVIVWAVVGAMAGVFKKERDRG